MADNSTLLHLNAKDNTKQAFDAVDRSMKRMQSSGSQANTAIDRAARQSRQGLSQMSYQIQDVAVQLQGGQSPFIILAQQGSQILSIFGAGGAVVGAIVAVGAGIATALVPQLFNSNLALENLNKTAEESAKLFKELDGGVVVLSDSFLKMAQVSGSAAAIELNRQRREALDALSAGQDAILKQTAEFNALMERASNQVAPLAAGSIAGLGTIYGITEENMRSLQTLSEGAMGGSIEQIEAFLAALAEIQAQDGVTERFNEMAESLSTMLVASVNAQQEISQVEAALSDLDGFVNKTIISTSESAKADEKKAESVKKMIEALQQQADTFDYGSTAIALYEARLADATVEQQVQIALLAGEVELRERAADAAKLQAQEQDKLLKASEAAQAVIKKEAIAQADPIDQLNQQYFERAEALREALKTEGIIQTEHNVLMVDLEKERIKAIAEYEKESYDKQMQMVHARYQAAGQLAGALAGVFEEGTTAQRAFLAVQKGLAVGEAIMNMHRAISSANAVPFPANLAAIAQAASTGLGAIAGIKAVSFEGGGFTGYGARAGGIDGIGGMPAIVHPNETIIDHTKGGGGINVNITIQANDTHGFDELLNRRRGMIASMVQSSLNNMGRTI